MTKINTKVLSGFAEYLPAMQVEFDCLREIIYDEYVAHGFLPLDLPLIYRSEVLLAKAGGETEKQIYKLQRGDNELALRFDLTVPLARYVVENQGQLNFPLKIAQIAKSYRGERAQMGRFREFYQCDADVIGKDELNLAYDAEVIGLIVDVYNKLDLGRFTVHVGHRKILAGFIEALGLSKKLDDILHVIDKKQKISVADFKSELQKLDLDDSQIAKLIELVNLSGTNAEILKALHSLDLQNEEFTKGVNELKTVMETLEMQQKAGSVQIDLQIVRGLDYYTGTVFETTLNDLPELGSVAGGGRYDNLASNYTREKYPGVGVSIGLTRLFDGLQKAKKLGQVFGTKTGVMILPIDQNKDQIEFCFKLANALREVGKNVDILLQPMPIKKKLKYADKLGVANVIVVGDDEVASGRTLVKNMQSGEVVNFDEFIHA